eukprot:Trichotokara_eunicae@DN6358_c0_g1_i7.p1
MISAWVNQPYIWVTKSMRVFDFVRDSMERNQAGLPQTLKGLLSLLVSIANDDNQTAGVRHTAVDQLIAQNPSVLQLLEKSLETNGFVDGYEFKRTRSVPCTPMAGGSLSGRDSWLQAKKNAVAAVGLDLSNYQLKFDTELIKFAFT